LVLAVVEQAERDGEKRLALSSLVLSGWTRSEKYSPEKSDRLLFTPNSFRRYIPPLGQVVLVSVPSVTNKSKCVAEIL
jgi:hypothetical protein